MQFHVLGPVRAIDEHGERAIGGLRLRRLLVALLLADGHTVSIDRLVDAVWGGEEPPDAAARTVLSYVSRLRSALGDGSVVTTSDGYSLPRRAADLDADRFAALITAGRDLGPVRAFAHADEALALWHGRPFGEIADDEWCRPAATRLEEFRLVALAVRMQARLELGAADEIVADLRTLCAEHPTREQFRSQLMLALHRAGRQAEALRAFQEHRERQVEDTGLDPSDELIVLDRRIAALDPSLRWAPPCVLMRGYAMDESPGAGQTGGVRVAVQAALGRAVTVRVMTSDVVEPAGSAPSFEQHAAVVMRLSHPRMAPLVDCWSEPGAVYLVHARVRGTSVADDVRPWSLDRVGRLVDDVGDALGVRPCRRRGAW